ncbi:MAG: hypothetical protein II443_04005, partial [Oscillospiraceae bacterium]|nr:hypothetical protein [Oscillospiraceae bacterium]
SSAFSMLIGISSLVGSIILSAKAQDEKCGFKIAQRLCAVALSMIALTAGYYFLVDRGASLNAFLILFCLGCLFIGLMVTFVNIRSIRRLCASSIKTSSARSRAS